MRDWDSEDKLKESKVYMVKVPMMLSIVGASAFAGLLIGFHLFGGG